MTSKKSKPLKKKSPGKNSGSGTATSSGRHTGKTISLYRSAKQAKPLSKSSSKSATSTAAKPKGSSTAATKSTCKDKAAGANASSTPMQTARRSANATPPDTKAVSKTVSNVINVGGRPPLWDTPEELQTLVDGYFKTIADQQLARPLASILPTVNGLSYHLGCHRDSFNEYSRKPGFSDIIKRALTRMGIDWEMRLAGGQAGGPIFWLKNQGWEDSKALTGPGGTPLVPRSKEDLTEDELLILAKGGTL